MSDLINSIFDVEAISKQKKQVEDELEDLKKQIEGYAENVQKIYANTRTAKNADDLAKNSKKLNDQIVKGTEATKLQIELQKQLEAQEKKLIQAQAKKIIAVTNEQAEINKLNATTRERNKIAKLEATLLDENAGKEEKLKAEIALLRIQKSKLKEDDEDYAGTIAKLNDRINENTNELKKNNDAEQERTSNIGKYEESILSAVKKLKEEGDHYKANMAALELITKSEKASTEEKEKATLAIEQNKYELARVNDELSKYGENVGESNKSSIQLIEGFKAGEISVKQLGKGFINLGKQMIKTFITNPITAIILAVAVAIKGVVDAFGRSEERTNKLKESFARLQPIMQLVRKGFDAIADGVIFLVDGLTKGISAVTNFFHITSKEGVKAAEDLAKGESKLREEQRKSRLIQLQYQKDAEKLRQQRDDESKSIDERIQANKKLGDTLREQLNEELRIAKLALSTTEARIKQDGASTELLDKRAEALTEIADIEERITGQASEQLVNENSLRKEAADAERQRAEESKAAADKIISERRRLIDSQIAILEDGQEKEIIITNENFKRQIEDLKANGQLTNELYENLELAHQKEVQKIKDDYAKQDEEKSKEGMEKAFADFQNGLSKEVEAIQQNYEDKEQELKRQFAAGLISREKYEADLLYLQTEAAKEANDKSIELLQNQLDTAELSTDKRAELSAKLRDLQIENENAVLDATIKANDDKVQADKDALEKRKEVAGQLKDASLEVFGAISDFQKQQSENRIAEIDAQQKANDDLFNKQQANLDNAILSEENREAAQKKIDEEKAARDAALAKKLREEKIKQAKWEKAQSLVSAIVGGANATVGALGAKPWTPLNFVFATLAGLAAAAQISTIASQKIPAYAKGGVTKNEFALWGEQRPEVAITTTGQIMYAEKPTVSKFDAGTRIFKSVEDFEKNMSISMSNGKNFEFDYDKMAEKMPRSNINLNASGLWSEISQEGNRITHINRWFKLGN